MDSRSRRNNRSLRVLLCIVIASFTLLSLSLESPNRGGNAVTAFTLRPIPKLGKKLRLRRRKEKQLIPENSPTGRTTSLDDRGSSQNSIDSHDFPADIDDPSASSVTRRQRVTRAATGLASSIRQKFKYSRQKMEEQLEEQDISDEASASAGIYMSPQTATLANHVQITWEPAAADHIRALKRVSNPNRPLMIGVVGIPGSGKSTSCDILAKLLTSDTDGSDSDLNGNNNNNLDLRPLVMPMDGYHYSMAQLLEFPNAEDAIYRRGACDTFDSEGLARDLERIAHGLEPIVQIPGFDHAKGDPTPAQHTFNRDDHNVVICDGLYLLHDQDGWEHIQKYLDWTIYISADVETCIERLKERNKCIPGYTAEEIAIRCDAVDRVNALLASETASKYASQIVASGASY